MNQRRFFSLSGKEMMSTYDGYIVAIKAGGSRHVVREAFLLRSVMMARLDNVQPPFLPGDAIIPKVGSVDSIRPLGIILSPEEEYIAKSLEYLGQGKWMVEINEKVHALTRVFFPAEKLEKVQPQIVTRALTGEMNISECQVGLSGDSLTRISKNIRAT